MTKRFKGFSEQQTEILARKMGFDGPMQKFGEFLKSSPAHASKFSSYENKAKEVVSGVKTFADGGVVTPPIRQTTSSAPKPETDKEKRKREEAERKTAIPKSLVYNTTSTGATTTRDMLANPENYVTPVATEDMEVSDNELVDQNSGQVGTNPNVNASTVQNTATAANPNATPAATVDTTFVTPSVNASLDQTTAAKGTVSQGATVEAATALPSSDATVAGQMAKLMAQFEGGATPAWAAGAIRNANAVMAARGLGSSSIAGGAVTQAAMESAIQIAAQDAATFSSFEMQNLNNRQQARLVNAQSFLQMDLANLDNEQQTSLFKAQARIQSLFTDQAADNASKQFNATSQNQTDQFFASLKSQVETFNVAQKNAMAEFNAGQTNSVEMFNRQLNDARDQFNAANRLVIDQSNATWRRQVTTTNNATINEANRINAQTASGMTLAAYNNVMQTERDFYTFAYESAQRAEDRSTELAIAKMTKSSGGSGLGKALGGLVGTIVGGLFK